MSRIDSDKDGEKKILCREYDLLKELKVPLSCCTNCDEVSGTGKVRGSQVSLDLIRHGTEVRSS